MFWSILSGLIVFMIFVNLALWHSDEPDEEGGRLMYNIVYREGGNLIRDATPYASADEAELLIEQRIEVVEIVHTA